MTEINLNLDKPILKKADKIIGNHLVFRNASVKDAKFILDLRTDIKKSRFISYTKRDIGAQKDWLDKYSRDNSQAYFIIQNKIGEALGTIRLYDQKGDSFSWGSWILKDGISKFFGLESILILYCYGLQLGFMMSHFNARKKNIRVWKFYEKLGAKRIGETWLDYFFSISKEEIEDLLKKYSEFLPNGIQVLNKRT
ncbi:MAG: GNAT family N-acetyltransferase [Rickettsiales bacterium]|nr:GNAT family N-acetyltransferase [Rickettsiales bacterium]